MKLPTLTLTTRSTPSLKQCKTNDLTLTTSLRWGEKWSIWSSRLGWWHLTMWSGKRRSKLSLNSSWRIKKCIMRKLQKKSLLLQHRRKWGPGTMCCSMNSKRKSIPSKVWLRPVSEAWKTWFRRPSLSWIWTEHSPRCSSRSVTWPRRWLVKT